MADESSHQHARMLMMYKEREMQELRDSEFAHLQHLLSERDELLVESSRRFEQLKTDFLYNLTLIKARDEDLDKMSNSLKLLKNQYEEAESEKNSLRIKLEAVSIRAEEAARKHDSEKSDWKKYVDGCEEIVRNLSWTNEESLRAKDREIAVVKEEMGRMRAAANESLESQRRDLTDMFERTLQGRDLSQAANEREVSKQINALSMRCEHIMTENSGLNASLLEANRKLELQAEDMAAKEEIRRQLQWQLDDERSQKLQGEDAIQRRVQQLQLELTTLKESAAKEVSELKRVIDKSVQELTREREFRVLLESRVEEHQTVFDHDRRTLQSELHEFRVHENLMQDEIVSLRAERDSSLSRVASLRLELEAAELRVKNSHKEGDLLRQELQTERNKVSEYDSKLLRLSQEYQQYRDDVREKESKSLHIASEQILETRNSSLEETTRLREQHKIDIDNLRKMHMHDLKMTEEACRNKITQSEASLAELRQQLADERTDAAAVSLRLTLREQEIATLRHEMSERMNMQRTGDVSAFSHEEEDMFRGGDGPSSPAFSQDLGPASVMSYPDSPMLFSSQRFGNTNTNNNLRGDFNRAIPAAQSSRGPSSSSAKSFHELQQRCLEAETKLELLQVQNKELQTNCDKAQLDSDRLRESIKLMRKEMEDSAVQAAETATLKSKLAEAYEELEEARSQSLGDAQKIERLKAVEVHIGQLQDECHRLRNERQKLVDIGSELQGRNNQLVRKLEAAGVREADKSLSLFDMVPSSPASARGPSYMMSSPARPSSSLGYVPSPIAPSYSHHHHDPPQYQHYPPHPPPRPTHHHYQHELEHQHYQPQSHSQSHLATQTERSHRVWGDMHVRTRSAPDNISTKPTSSSSLQHTSGRSEHSGRQHQQTSHLAFPPQDSTDEHSVKTEHVIETSAASPPRQQRKSVAAPPLSPSGKLFDPVSDTEEREEREERAASSERKSAERTESRRASQSSSAAATTADELNLEGRAIVSGSAPAVSVNRGVSVFHNKHSLPVPISNSDRATSSQLKALNGLKNRRASTSSIPIPRKNHFKGEDS